MPEGEDGKSGYYKPNFKNILNLLRLNWCLKVATAMKTKMWSFINFLKIANVDNHKSETEKCRKLYSRKRSCEFQIILFHKII